MQPGGSHVARLDVLFEGDLASGARYQCVATHTGRLKITAEITCVDFDAIDASYPDRYSLQVIAGDGEVLDSK